MAISRYSVNEENNNQDSKAHPEVDHTGGAF
jgi:hypothetical protein